MAMRRLHSIEWKFPVLMSGLVVATAAVFLWAVQSQFSEALYKGTGLRLKSSALLISNMISAGVPRPQARMRAVAEDPAVIRYLATGEGRAEAQHVVESAPVGRDSAYWRIQLLDRSGAVRLEKEFRTANPRTDWARRQIAEGALGSAPFVFGPIIDVGGHPQYELVSAVFSQTPPLPGSAPIGHVVETRIIAGTGAQTIRKLVGDGAILLVGVPGGSWTDLEKIVRPPPPFLVAGEPFIVEESSRGPGIGVATPVAGTPWFVWLRQPRELVVAPVREFVTNIVPRSAAIALVAALLAWLLARGITLRIARLTKDVDRLEPGDGPSRDRADDARDEIERLCAAFDRMARRLKTHQDLEAQLRQAQKLEAVGRLAGGVAHDFNNILTVIRNYGEMVRESLPAEDELTHDMTEILRATDRAGALTAQLLAFSRRQVVTPRVLDLNQVIEGAERMLRRLIPSHIEFLTILDQRVGCINADAGQIEQVLLNLSINALDAMPSGGRLTIQTQNTELDNTFSNGTGTATAGDKVTAVGTYATIVVSDTGVGMDRDTLSRIFDPFFTTKPIGKGTGLGLSTTHGIVTQNNGRIWVYSEPGRGTTFKLYFPIADGGVIPDIAVKPAGELRRLEGGRETILLVEDDPSTRKVTRRLLEKWGYQVLEADNGIKALEVISLHEGPIDLVLTDLIMPGMNGAELATRLTAMRPELAVILMSGYADHDVLDSSLPYSTRAFIEKPFTAAKLLDSIRTELHLGGRV